MKELFEEYGSMILAIVGTMALVGILWIPLFSKGGLVAKMVLLWCGSGC